jgi:hypothetical protein
MITLCPSWDMMQAPPKYKWEALQFGSSCSANVEGMVMDCLTSICKHLSEGINWIVTGTSHWDLNQAVHESVLDGTHQSDYLLCRGCSTRRVWPMWHGNDIWISHCLSLLCQLESAPSQNQLVLITGQRVTSCLQRVTVKIKLFFLQTTYQLLWLCGFKVNIGVGDWTHFVLFQGKQSIK